MGAGAVAARTVIALGVAAGLALAVRDGAATEWGRSDPARAAGLAPSDARLAVQAARARVDAGAPATDPAVRDLVRRALVRDVTLPPAVELRALDAEASGDKRRAAALFALSDRISRRSLGTRVWLIQQAVERGDVDGALRDFDIALRTSSAAPPILFPVLASALSDPDLVPPIARLLDRPSDWRAMFLHDAVVERRAPPGVTDLVLAVRDRAMVRRAGADQALIGQLVAQAAFGEARRVRDAFQPLARAEADALLADPTFSRPDQAAPFGWRLTERGELEAIRGVVGGRPALTYQALGGAGGVAAVQLLTLPVGDYRLSVRTAATDPAAVPFWTLTCGEAGGRQLLQLDQAHRPGGEASGEVTVPDGCSGQWLALHLRRADAATQAGAVASVSLVRR